VTTSLKEGDIGDRMSSHHPKFFAVGQITFIGGVSSFLASKSARSYFYIFSCHSVPPYHCLPVKISHMLHFPQHSCPIGTVCSPVTICNLQQLLFPQPPVPDIPRLKPVQGVNRHMSTRQFLPWINPAPAMSGREVLRPGAGSSEPGLCLLACAY